MSHNTCYTSKTNYSDLAVKIQANAAILFPDELILNVVVFKAHDSDLYMAKPIRPVHHKTFMTTPLFPTSFASLEQLYWKSIKGVTNHRMKSWWRWKTAEERANLRKDGELMNQMMSKRGVASDVLKAKMNLSVEERRAFDAAMREIMGIPNMDMIMQGISVTHQTSMRK